ncbi:MAG: F0F1 ATP synthase subunit epsilon [Steroidobacteraceae bacterium]|jgi:F-type H+-transporting ATPase subunit epsilon
MNLEILLPYRIYARESDVLRIVAENSAGCFELLPHRLDCVAALVPGILTYTIAQSAPIYLAIDEGVLVKSGADVLVSVRRAIGGTDLSQLQRAVKSDFQQLGAREREVRAAVAKIEAGLIARVAEFDHGR